MPGIKNCFVVMGFGEKTDFQSNPQRILNLDKTFEYIIAPTVAECGLECIRADKIIHSTVIDKPMYEHLLEADLVIADLSTSNANAIYELGVRHALRPHTTIVMAEKNFKFPFDLNHVSILTYEHLGHEIGHGEVKRVTKVLKEKIEHLLHQLEVDSPVFLFLPLLAHATATALSSAGETTRALVMESAAASAPAPSAPRVSEASFADLTENFRKAKAAVKQPADWLEVIAFLKALQTMQPNEAYVIQQLALATYKSELPGKLTASRKAKEILTQLAPATSSDGETVGLWGAVHKRLWQDGGDRADLDRAIRAYARGYFLKTDYYNGINLACLLNVRSSISEGEEAICDRVQARRIRTEVLDLCKELLGRGGLDADDAFWVLATMVEAKVGLGAPDADALLAEAQAKAPAAWMAKTMVEQVAKLSAVLG
jgi:hypothetical protein